MNNFFLRASLTAVGLAAATAWADDAPDGTEIYIEDLSYRGTGCSQGSVSWNLSDDGKAVTLLYDEFFVETTERARRNGKICTVKLDLNVPRGYSFAVAEVDIRGYASLDVGTVGRQTVAYNPSPFFWDFRLIGNMRIDGHFDDDYEENLKTPVHTLSWSPCSRNTSKRVEFITNIAVRKRNRGASAFLQVDSLDAELLHRFNLTWKKCPGFAFLQPNPRGERPDPHGRNNGGRRIRDLVDRLFQDIEDAFHNAFDRRR